MTYFDLLKFANNNPDARIRFMVDDKFYTLDPISNYPEFYRELTFYTLIEKYHIYVEHEHSVDINGWTISLDSIA